MINKINKLKEEGKTIREIAEILNISKSYVHKLISGQNSIKSVDKDISGQHNNDLVDIRQEESVKKQYNHSIGYDIFNKCKCNRCLNE